MEDAHNCIVTQFCEEVKAKTILDTTSTPPPLSGVALGNVCLDQAARLSLLVEPHLAMFSRVNDAGDIRDGDSGFRDVGRFR